VYIVLTRSCPNFTGKFRPVIVQILTLHLSKMPQKCTI